MSRAIHQPAHIGAGRNSAISNGYCRLCPLSGAILLRGSNKCHTTKRFQNKACVSVFNVSEVVFTKLGKARRLSFARLSNLPPPGKWDRGFDSIGCSLEITEGNLVLRVDGFSAGWSPCVIASPLAKQHANLLSIWLWVKKICAQNGTLRKHGLKSAVQFLVV